MFSEEEDAEYINILLPDVLLLYPPLLKGPHPQVVLKFDAVPTSHDTEIDGVNVKVITVPIGNVAPVVFSHLVIPVETMNELPEAFAFELL